MLAGITFRPELEAWLTTRPAEVRCVEFSVDQALNGLPASPAERLGRPPATLHAARLSALTPAPLDPADIELVTQAVCAVDPIWVSVYLGCRRRPETELWYPQPVNLSGATLGRAIATCRCLIDAGVRPLLVENVTAFGVGDASSSPARFINQLCDESGCQLLVDVTALALDSRFGFDVRRWIWDVHPAHVMAMRLGVCARGARGRWAGRQESEVPDDAWELACELTARTHVGSAILQCDGRPPRIVDIQQDLHRLASLGHLAAVGVGRRERELAVR
jgi:uncharacterized protein (UPF0276 family)